jgi:formate hydrogenlyase subunit 6/NADH:ubiquinone oxidoreductase subunit I
MSSTGSRPCARPTSRCGGTARPASAARAARRSTASLVTDVSFNYEKAKEVPAFKPKPKEADGTRRMYQEDVDRVQEFHKCIECFLCQDTCHVIRDHEENKTAFAGPRMFVRYAALEMHPLDTNDRMELIRAKAGLGFCNITKCCSEVCPEDIHITDNAIIPLKERVVTEFYDPLAWVKRRVMGQKPTQPGKGVLVLAFVLLVLQPGVERGGIQEVLIIAAIFAGILAFERYLRTR